MRVPVNVAADLDIHVTVDLGTKNQPLFMFLKITTKLTPCTLSEFIALLLSLS